MLLLFISLISQTDSVYNLRDFRIPESGAFKLWADIGADYSSSWSLLPRFYDSIHVEKNVTKKDADSRICMQLLRESDRLNFDIYSEIELGGAQDQEHNKEYESRIGPDTLGLWPWDTIDVTIWDDVELSNSLSGSLYSSQEVLYYPVPGISFIGCDNGISLYYDRNKTWEEYNYYESNYNRFSQSNRTGSRFSLGASLLVGFGKIRDLTFPSRAIAVEDILYEFGFTSHNPELVNDLAEHFANRWIYPIKYWKPDHRFYEDMENIFVEYGIPRDEIRIRDWMDIMDISYLWDRSYGIGRPYGLQLTIRPIHFYLYIGNYHDYGSRYDNLTVTSYEENNERFSFGWELLKIELEGGYPLSRNMNLEGDLTFVTKFFNSFYKYRDEAIYDDSIYYQRDTSFLIKDYEFDDFEFSARVLLHTYVLYNLDIFLGVNGNNTYYLHEDDEWSNEFFTNLFLECRYLFMNRFLFDVSGSINYRVENISTYLIPDRILYPKASVSIMYRFI